MATTEVYEDVLTKYGQNAEILLLDGYKECMKESAFFLDPMHIRNNMTPFLGTDKSIRLQT